MKQEDAERLARDLRPPELAAGTSSDTPTYADAVGVVVTAGNLRRLCDHILSGAMKREIENAAFERADVEIAKWERRSHVLLHAGEMKAQELRSVIAVVGAIRASVKALIQPPAQKENGE